MVVEPLDRLGRWEFSHVSIVSQAKTRRAKIPSFWRKRKPACDVEARRAVGGSALGTGIQLILVTIIERASSGEISF